MNLVSSGKTTLRKALAHLGYSVRRIGKDERSFLLAGHDGSVPLPAGAEDYLRYDNPRLLELQQRYQKVESPVCQHTYWRPQLQANAMDLRYFRGDNAYVWQFRHLRDHTRVRYYLYARYVRDMDRRGLLGKTVTEDGQFGCFNYRFDEIPVISRDLLDSVAELYFLDRHWGLFERKGVQVLDIGAGYGRLAHRMLAAAEGVTRYWCIDAVPRSTFLCEYYLRHRGCLDEAGGRAKVVPLDEMRTAVPPKTIDLALNVHSFSEMSHAAIETWINWVAELQVPYLMVLPNEPDMLSKEADGSRREYRSVIKQAGYRLVAKESTILDSDVRKIFGINDFLFLYQRDGAGR